MNTVTMSRTTRAGVCFLGGGRGFSNSARADNFFNLGARAMSRENLYMSKQAGATGKNYIEHSPSLQLLQSERDLAEGRSRRKDVPPHKMEAQAAVNDIFNRDEIARHSSEEDALLVRLGIKEELSARIANLVERRVADETRARLAKSQIEHQNQTSDEVRRLTLEVEHLEQMRLLDSQRRSRNRIRYFAFTFAFLAGLSYASLNWTKEQRDQMKAILDPGRIETRRKQAGSIPVSAVTTEHIQPLLVEPVQPVVNIVETEAVPANRPSSWSSGLGRFACGLFWKQQ